MWSQPAHHGRRPPARGQSGQPAGVLATRSFPRLAGAWQQWRTGAVLPKVHLNRHGELRARRRWGPCLPHIPRPAGGERGPRSLQEALGHRVRGRNRRKPQHLASGSPWRSAAPRPKQREHRRCGLLRSARVPQRGATRAATMMPGSAARSAPSGWRAGVTETAKSPRPQCQWARTTNSASKHRQEAEVSCQRITKACCSTTAGPEQKHREQRARLAHAPRAFNDLRRGLLKRALAVRAPRVTSLARCPSGQPTGVLVPRSVKTSLEHNILSGYFMKGPQGIAACTGRS